jgi:hypothetical protein
MSLVVFNQSIIVWFEDARKRFVLELLLSVRFFANRLNWSCVNALTLQVSKLYQGSDPRWRSQSHGDAVSARYCEAAFKPIAINKLRHRVLSLGYNSRYLNGSAAFRLHSIVFGTAESKIKPLVAPCVVALVQPRSLSVKHFRFQCLYPGSATCMQLSMDICQQPWGDYAVECSGGLHKTDLLIEVILK